MGAHPRYKAIIHGIDIRIDAGRERSPAKEASLPALIAWSIPPARAGKEKESNRAL
jgi:hypothetical protein